MFLCTNLICTKSMCTKSILHQVDQDPIFKFRIRKLISISFQVPSLVFTRDLFQVKQNFRMKLCREIDHIGSSNKSGIHFYNRALWPRNSRSKSRIFAYSNAHISKSFNLQIIKTTFFNVTFYPESSGIKIQHFGNCFRVPTPGESRTW